MNPRISIFTNFAVVALSVVSSILVITSEPAADPLILNGQGKRQATIFKIDVYEAKLYLEAKSVDPVAIMNSSQHKKLDLHFLRDVSKDKINSAWEDGFKNNSALTTALETKLRQLQSLMTDVQDGKILSFEWLDDKVIIRLHGELLGEIAGKDFQQTMLKIWLGPKPPNESLKNGLLGK